jgi:membrane-associated phospholipid phosphatase
MRNRCLGALGVVLLVIGTALVLDPRVHAWAAQSKCHTIDALVAILNPIGSGVTLLIACIMLTAICRALPSSRLQAAAWTAALAFTFAGVIEFTIKHLVGRPRPDTAMAFATLGSHAVAETDSFPSGHATSVFAVATVFAAFYPWLRWPLYALAAAVAVGRVYLERHYMSDILAGAVIGIAIASLLLRHRRSVQVAS